MRPFLIPGGLWFHTGCGSIWTRTKFWRNGGCSGFRLPQIWNSSWIFSKSTFSRLRSTSFFSKKNLVFLVASIHQVHGSSSTYLKDPLFFNLTCNLEYLKGQERERERVPQPNFTKRRRTKSKVICLRRQIASEYNNYDICYNRSSGQNHRNIIIFENVTKFT